MCKCEKRAPVHFVDNDGRNQPMHLYSLVMHFAGFLQNHWILWNISMNREGSTGNQTAKAQAHLGLCSPLMVHK